MKTTEEHLKDAMFFVEANSFEQLCLWREEAGKVKWEEVRSGSLIPVGYVADNKQMPVYVSFNFAILNGRTVCFYYSTSRFVDSDLVTAYLDTNYPVTYDNGRRKARTDAMNFGTCIGEILK